MDWLQFSNTNFNRNGWKLLQVLSYLYNLILIFFEALRTTCNIFLHYSSCCWEGSFSNK